MTIFQSWITNYFQRFIPETPAETAKKTWQSNTNQITQDQWDNKNKPMLWSLVNSILFANLLRHLTFMEPGHKKVTAICLFDRTSPLTDNSTGWSLKIRVQNCPFISNLKRGMCQIAFKSPRAILTFDIFMHSYFVVLLIWQKNITFIGTVEGTSDRWTR